MHKLAKKIVFSLLCLPITFFSQITSIIFSYTKYSTQKNYWSDYVGAYYKQECWKDIKIYKDSIAPHNLIAGPFDGSWYDPVRPF